MCFSVNFVKFLRTPFLQNTSERLLLHCSEVAFLLNYVFLHANQDIIIRLKISLELTEKNVIPGKIYFM